MTRFLSELRGQLAEALNPDQDLSANEIHGRDSGQTMPHNQRRLRLVHEVPNLEEGDLSTGVIEGTERGEVEFSLRNFSLTYRPNTTETEKTTYSGFRITLRDSEGEEIGKVFVSKMRDDQLARTLEELHEMMAGADKEPWRRVPLPDVLPTRDYEGDTLINTAKDGKLEMLSRERLGEILKKAESRGAEVRSNFTEGDGISEIVKAYQAKMDTVGIARGINTRLKDALANKPMMQVLEIEEGEAELSVSTSVAELPVVSVGELRLVDVSKPSEELLRELAEREGIAKEIIDNCLTEDAHSHVTEIGDHLFTGEHFLEEDGPRLKSREMHFIISKDTIFMIHNGDIGFIPKTLEKLAGSKSPDIQGVADLYYKVSSELRDANQELIRDYGNTLRNLISSLQTNKYRPRPGIDEHLAAYDGTVRHMKANVRLQKEIPGRLEAFLEGQGVEVRNSALARNHVSNLNLMEEHTTEMLGKLEKVAQLRNAVANQVTAYGVVASLAVGIVSSIAPWVNNFFGIQSTGWQVASLVVTGVAAGVGLFFAKRVLDPDRKLDKKLEPVTSRIKKAYSATRGFVSGVIERVSGLTGSAAKNASSNQ